MTFTIPVGIGLITGGALLVKWFRKDDDASITNLGILMIVVGTVVPGFFLIQ